MTLSASSARNSYACKGATTVFPYTFRILDESHLKVILRDADGLDTVLTLNTDYTVSGVGTSTGGNVTTVATYAIDNTLVIIRNVPFAQDTAYVENDEFPAETHEEILDKIVMMIQQLNDLLSRVPSLDVGSAYSSLTFPDPVGGSYIKWKADLSGFENEVTTPTDTDPDYYASTMTGDETITYVDGYRKICFLDPGGSDRNFDPAAGYISGYEITIINTGNELITFDSPGLAQAVGPGQKASFHFDGTNWI